MSIFNKEREWKFFIEEINSIGNNLLINSDISLNGNLNVNNVLFAFVPRGIICMWSGVGESIPNGWNICDGTNGTPDLRDRFIVGAGNDYQKGDIGGEDSVTLTIPHLPSHSHGIGNLTLTEDGNHIHTTAQANSDYTHELPTLPGSADKAVLCVSDNSDQLLTQSSRYNNSTNFTRLKTGGAGEHSHQIGGYLQAYYTIKFLYLYRFNKRLY